MDHGSLFIVHCSLWWGKGHPTSKYVSAQGEYGPLHNWLDLRVCAKFGGFFSGANGISRCR